MSTVIYHNHHIIPKHAGGTDHPDNIARLTVEEHTEAHRLLYEKYGRWQDKLAYEGLAGFKGKEEIISQSISRKGTKHTPEAKKKISEKAKGNTRCAGRKCSPEVKKRLSEMFKGRTYSEETKKRMSEGQKRRHQNKLYNL